jgi:hypothetical protein
MVTIVPIAIAKRTRGSAAAPRDKDGAKDQCKLAVCEALEHWLATLRFTDCAAWVLAVGMALADALAVAAARVTAYELVLACVTTSPLPPDSHAGNHSGTTGARQ